MNKKAFLLAEETLKVVVAVICLIFLAYFLTSLYYSKINDEKLKFAKDILGTLNEKITLLEDGGFFEQDVVNPNGWYLIGFTNDIKPNSCSNQNCICICPIAYDYKGTFNRQQKKCDDKGSCLIINELRNIPLELKITTNPALFLKVEKDNGRVLINKK